MSETETAPPPTEEDGGLFSLAEQDAPPPPDADGKPQRPEGLPENFWDPDKGAIRADQLVKSWRDLRGMVSRGEHKAPEKPEAYQLPAVEGLPEGFIGGEGDTLWPTLRTAAHQAGVTQKQLEALATPFLQAVAAAQKDGPSPDAKADPEAYKAAYAAEMAKLGPNGEALTRDVGGWMKGLASRGVLSGPELAALRGITTAEGVRALAKLREMTGEKPMPVDAIGGDIISQADAERMMQESYAKNDEGMRAKARAALQELEKRGLLISR